MAHVIVLGSINSSETDKQENYSVSKLWEVLQRDSAPHHCLTALKFGKKNNKKKETLVSYEPLNREVIYKRTEVNRRRRSAENQTFG